MKYTIKYEWNKWTNPPKPWAKIVDDKGYSLTAAMGVTWQEAKENAINRFRE